MSQLVYVVFDSDNNPLHENGEERLAIEYAIGACVRTMRGEAPEGMTVCLCDAGGHLPVLMSSVVLWHVDPGESDRVRLRRAETLP